MTIGVLANSAQKEELLAQGLAAGIHVEWMAKPELLPGAAAIIDLLNKTDEYPAEWREQNGILLFINQVEDADHDRPGHFIRINGWPGFLGRPLLEASVKDPYVKTKAESILSAFNKKAAWVADIPGFLSARVLAAIINEAYLSLEEGVSTKEQIDTAMKLGTNYPHGPFEWTQQIGADKLFKLLSRLAENNKRYQPAALLKKEARL